MKDYVIILNDGALRIVKISDYLKAKDKYEYIDDLGNEYKAEVKLKEIKAMGLDKFRSLRKVESR